MHMGGDRFGAVNDAALGRTLCLWSIFVRQIHSARLASGQKWIHCIHGAQLVKKIRDVNYVNEQNQLGAFLGSLEAIIM